MRAKNSLKNIVTGIGLQLITVALGFISRKVFIDLMGVELLGVNAILTNVLAMLSLVELGIGSAIYYSLYKPLADNNQAQIHAIMDLYAKMYRYIGLAVAVIGLCLLPFLNYLVDSSLSSQYVMTIFLVFLADSVLSYFLAYRRNILSANQQTYIINKLSTVFFVVTNVAQILIIILTKNYLLFLAVKAVSTVVQNLIIYKTTNEMYPYLKNKNTVVLDPEIKAEIIKNAKALFVVNLSVYFVFGTDNILLSLFAGVIVVGIYSNYVLLINTINGIIGQIFVGVRASFGNFIVEKNKDEVHEIFEVLYYVNFWISTFCAVSLLTLMNGFINIWLGPEMLFPLLVVVILVFNFYSRSMTQAIETIRNGAGLYSPYPFFKYWALVEGLLNLVLSFILAVPLQLGMYGVFLATSISTGVTVFVLPWNVYKYVFERSSKGYYIKMLKYTVMTVGIGAISILTSEAIQVSNVYINFILDGIVTVISVNTMILLLTFRTKEFQYLWKRFKVEQMIKKIIKRRI